VKGEWGGGRGPEASGKTERDERRRGLKGAAEASGKAEAADA
jgi:hypothetical protein